MKFFAHIYAILNKTCLLLGIIVALNHLTSLHDKCQSFTSNELVNMFDPHDVDYDRLCYVYFLDGANTYVDLDSTEAYVCMLPPYCPKTVHGERAMPERGQFKFGCVDYKSMIDHQSTTNGLRQQPYMTSSYSPCDAELGMSSQRGSSMNMRSEHLRCPPQQPVVGLGVHKYNYQKLSAYQYLVVAVGLAAVFVIGQPTATVVVGHTVVGERATIRQVLTFLIIPAHIALMHLFFAGGPAYIHFPTLIYADVKYLSAAIHQSFLRCTMHENMVFAHVYVATHWIYAAYMCAMVLHAAVHVVLKKTKKRAHSVPDDSYTDEERTPPKSKKWIHVESVPDDSDEDTARDVVVV